jgi:predicted dehydrogenase
MDRKALVNTVDSVSVAVPTPYHYENVLMCIEEGVDVLVEKPFVDDPKKGRSLISETKKITSSFKSVMLRGSILLSVHWMK